MIKNFLIRKPKILIPAVFLLIVGLMVLFFVGLVGLEVVHMVWMGSGNDVIFNGIMLVVGTIVGAIWGRNAE